MLQIFSNLQQSAQGIDDLATVTLAVLGNHTSNTDSFQLNQPYVATWTAPEDFFLWSSVCTEWPQHEERVKKSNNLIFLAKFIKS